MTINLPVKSPVVPYLRRSCTTPLHVVWSSRTSTTPPDLAALIWEFRSLALPGTFFKPRVFRFPRDISRRTLRLSFQLKGVKHLISMAPLESLKCSRRFDVEGCRVPAICSRCNLFESDTPTNICAFFSIVLVIQYKNESKDYSYVRSYSMRRLETAIHQTYKTTFWAFPSQHHLLRTLVLQRLPTLSNKT